MTPSNYVPEELLPFYRKAGNAAATGLQHGATLVKEGARPVEILDAIEEKIKSLGAGIGFPAQLSINECAAHACADDNDETVLKEGDVVKLDCGAHVNGCIGDNALTVDLSTNGQWTELLKASKEARDTVIKSLHPGITPNEIGTTAQEVIESYGYRPVRNLCGHGLAPYVIHTSPSVPSYPNNVKTPIEEDHVIAIEPFATDGEGLIENGPNTTLFSQIRKAKPRSQIARDVLKHIEQYEGLPFTTRWLTRALGEGKTRYGLKELLAMGIINKYAPLPEVSKGTVAQFENTVLVKDKPEIFTRTD